MKLFLGEMSDQTNEISQYNIPAYFVYYCKQNKMMKVNESKLDNFIDNSSNSRNISYFFQYNC